VLGLAFKENCPDLRNTRVVDIIAELQEYGCDVDVFDPWVDPKEAMMEYGVSPIASPRHGVYDGLVLAVAHRDFKSMGAEDLRRLGKPVCVVYDLKNLLLPSESDLRL
jgi:UDP-N-acetyl-D-galactosamine dehydrogenase